MYPSRRVPEANSAPRMTSGGSLCKAPYANFPEGLLYDRHEDEAFCVLEGEVEFLLGGGTIPAGAGTCVHVPKGTLHTFRNVGTSPSRVLGVITPGGFERFFLEAGEPATEGSPAPEGEPDVGRIAEIGRRYGLEIPPPPGQ